MWNQLKEIEKQCFDLEQKLQDPHFLKNKKEYQKAITEHSKIKFTAETYRQYLSLKESLEEHLKMKEEADSDLASLVEEEIKKLQEDLKNKEQELKSIIQSQSKDVLDQKNVIIELRAGAGGEEAGLFCRELFQTYERYTQLRGWKLDTLSCSLLPSGGFREVIAKINGKDVYAYMKFERGVHRVQRVPQTESQGRVHTSTVTVAVLPEADPTDVQIKMEDVRIDYYRSSGAGGQHVNTTDSAVRLTHKPTKITVSCQDEKSQHANKDKAFKILYARLFNFYEEEKRQKDSQMRLKQIGSGERSEKIRTYNFPQNRVTDHRIALTLHSLDRVMKGDMDLLIQPLSQKMQSEGS